MGRYWCLYWKEVITEGKLNSYCLKHRCKQWEPKLTSGKSKRRKHENRKSGCGKGN